MIELREQPEGIVFALKVRPGGKRNAVVGDHDGALKVTVTAAPEKGKANAAVVKLLAKELGVAKSDLTIVRGETSSTKEILVKRLERSALAARLAALMAPFGPAGA
ncbi:hypothetical protein Pan216_47840 [Planctomycetes bacterium Pan216]|uniref:UPF0235 protein Pan216_47840 n=1 Tax=Kolteria novifilia TaxID=2527975 RepID=A0A518BAG4_9BACT|nr:hypothetical protein Pan216_47840 [Planctomycetes bacterium Pan216]